MPPNVKYTKTTTRMTASGLNAAFAILRKWECSIQEQISILSISKSSYYKYRRTPSSAHLSSEQIERVSIILNLHSYLRTLFENPENVYGFMQMPNKNRPFEGQTPLAYIGDGSLSSLKNTAQHLGGLLSQ